MLTDIARFEFAGDIPSKKNSKDIFPNRKNILAWVQSGFKRVTGRLFYLVTSKRYQNWNARAMWQMKAQMQDSEIPFPIQECKWVKVWVNFGTKRKADLTNKAESLFDTMVEAGILKDDCWAVTGPIALYPAHKKNDGGAVVEIGI